MTSPPSSPPSPPSWDDLEAQLQQAEDFLRGIRDRLDRVRAAQADRQQLRQQQRELIARGTTLDDRAPERQEMQQALAAIAAQLELLDVELESRLLTWSSLKEPFWQIVRFGGLGVLIGAGLVLLGR